MELQGDSIVDNVVLFSQTNFGTELKPDDVSQFLRKLSFSDYLEVKDIIKSDNVDGFKQIFSGLLGSQVTEFVSPGTAAGARSVATSRADAIQDKRTDTAIQRTSTKVPGAPTANTVKPGEVKANTDDVEDAMSDIKASALEKAKADVLKQMKLAK